MTIIIGIDPGSRRTGYGVIKAEAGNHIYLSSGQLNVMHLPQHERLQHIFHQLQQILFHFKPQEAAIEQVFMHANPNSALKLGQARGAALVALNVPVCEYSARQIKKSVVGTGTADKDQVIFMVQQLLNIRQKTLQSDAADALAVALCHAQARHLKKLGIDF